MAGKEGLKGEVARFLFCVLFIRRGERKGADGQAGQVPSKRWRAENSQQSLG